MKKKFEIIRFFDDISPRIADFGRYTLNIQRNVFSTQKTNFDKIRVNTALTDADFIVQEGLLRTFLEKGYDFKVYAEEDSPYNEKFPKDNDILITLDPIDETLAYMNNLSNFCITLGVFNKGALEGALIHTPFYRKFYCASIEEENSFMWEIDYKEDSDKKIQLSHFNSKYCDDIVISYKSSEKVVNNLENLGIKVYQSDKNSFLEGFAIHSILRGEIAAFFRTNVPAIDWAPISLIMERGKGVVTDYQGNKDEIYQYWNRKNKWYDSRIPSLVVSGNREIHEKILGVLENEK